MPDTYIQCMFVLCLPERTTEVRNCTESEFRCNNLRCIRSRYKCDHQDDCGDNSDEALKVCSDCKYGLKRHAGHRLQHQLMLTQLTHGIS